VADSGIIAYTYTIGFIGIVPADSSGEDSLERIEILDESFARSFPMKVHLPGFYGEMILRKDGKIDILSTWMEEVQKGRRDTIFKALAMDGVFRKSNPFEYFRARTKTMDSLGIRGIQQNPASNGITVTIKEGEEYLEYLPDDLIVLDSYKNRFDSILATGKRINKNWVWLKLRSGR
jgi:hypothetical protein